MIKTKTDWISVKDRLPPLDETVDIYVGDEFAMTSPCSKVVWVAEKKGDGFEEDEGYLLRSGWATDCDYVSHWRYKSSD